jgi:NAD(P)-dependent dehydrogenase (short-subunit alcohol dehydrogenase family)
MKDLFRMDGRVAAVVGGGAGIGRAAAHGCASQGALVVCLDVDGGAAEDAAAGVREAGGRAEARQLDIRDRAEVESSMRAILDDHGRLDVVVCTPGVNVRKPLLAYTDEDFEHVVGLNLKGNLHVLQAAGAVMAEQGWGSIVLFSSIRSVVVEPGQGVYAATKAGIVQMVRAAAAELGPKGVRVNAIAPGVVDTPLTAPIKEDPDWYGAYAERNILQRWAKPDEMAGPTVFLASDASSYVTGSVLFADGGWTAVDGRFAPPGM